MQPETCTIALQAALRQRDAKIAALRRQLAAAPVAATGRHPGDLPNFLGQMQGLFAGVLTTDRQGHLTWANSRFRKHWGRRLPELLGQPLPTLLGGAALGEATQRLLADGLTAGHAFQVDLPDPGQPGGWLRLRLQPIRRGLGGEDQLLVGLLEDITAEKRAQLALAASERRYRELAEQAPGVRYRWRKNPAGTFTSLYTSPNMPALFGVTPGGPGDSTWEFDCQTKSLFFSPELPPQLAHPTGEGPQVGANPSVCTHPDDLPLLQQRWQNYLAGQTATFASEHRLRCPDGSYRWVLSRGLVTKRDVQGQPLLLAGLQFDITDRKHTEQALVTTALRLSATIDSLKRGILLVDDQQRVVQTNAAFCRIFNLAVPPEQLVGLLDREVAQLAKGQFADPDAFLRYVAATIARRQPAHDEVVTLRGGRVVQRSFLPVWQEQTNIGHLWKFEDITERYQDEQILKQQEEKYRHSIDNLHLGLIEIDLNYQVQYVNPSYCQMVGYPAHELVGRQVYPLILAPEQLAALREQKAARQPGEADSYELAITTKQGERKWLFIGSAPQRGLQGELTGTISVSLDITHQKQLEQNLREAKQQAEHLAQTKELFLANMSHEIRTPMNAILGMSQLLAKTQLAPRQSNYLHAITTSAQNLLVIINDILDISKLNAGKMSIEHVGFNVTRLVEQVAKTLLYKAEEKGLCFVTRVNPLIPDVVLGDPYRLTQVLLNLVSNSIKFTEKGEVTLECDVAGYHEGKIVVAFSVHDTGIGIDPAYLEHIFQEFSQEDSSVTRKFGGTGLGLSISRSLVRLMGCELRIESEQRQGTFSYFCLSLPIGTVHDLPQRKTLATGTLQELRGRRVLLVEDNEYNRLLAKTLLTGAGLEVTEAEHGAAALERVRAQAFDLILMDVQMPVMDGFEAARHLRQELGITTPIIALTASALNGEKQKCLDAGMNDYLTKPFFEDELLALVQEWALRPALGELVACAPPAAPLYNLDLLLGMARGNQQFVLSMLQTFLDGTAIALRDLNQALAVGNVAGLRATAHRLRPSLVHLQVQPVVALMDQLEHWESEFGYDDLQPVVEASDRLLRQVMAEIATKIETLRAAASG